MSECTRRDHSVWTTCTCPTCDGTRRRTAKLHRTGRYTRVPSDVAWARLTGWLDAGWSTQWIASAVGIPARYVEAIVTLRATGRTQGIGPTRARQIVNGNILNGTMGHAPALGITRRLQALARIGWTVEALGRELGLSFVTIAAVQRGAVTSVEPGTFHGVRAGYDRLSITPGRSTIAARRATGLGWAAPLAWDEGAIDDPAARPHGSTVTDANLIDDAAVERTLAGDRVPLTRPERVEVIRRLASRGLSDADMGAVVGITGRSVKRIRDEFGINTGWVAA